MSTLDIISGSNKIVEMIGVALPQSDDIDVPIDPRIDINTITADDDDPKFVNVEVLRSGISKTNRRRYNNNIVDEVHEMIPGLQGFLGHPDPSKQGYEFREPQCIFVGSITEMMPDGLKRVIAKTYLFKSSPLREWIPKSIAAGNPMTVSINGTGDVVKNGDIIDVIHMSQLQSIDWANPGTEGMSTSKAITVVTEMQDKIIGGNIMEGSVKDIIKNATVTELKAFNPDAVSGVVGSISITELQSMNPVLFNQVKESGKITEMQVKVGGKTDTVKITEMQGVIDTLETKITELQDSISDMKITELRNAKLNELVPEKYRESIGKRITGKTADEITTSINAEIAFIREMGGDISNTPAPNQAYHIGDSAKEIAESLFGIKKK